MAGCQAIHPTFLGQPEYPQPLPSLQLIGRMPFELQLAYRVRLGGRRVPSNSINIALGCPEHEKAGPKDDDHVAHINQKISSFVDVIS